MLRCAVESDPIIQVRDRAYELAETGDYGFWPEISEALTTEGHDAMCILRLNGDHFFQIMLRNRLRIARDKRNA